MADQPDEPDQGPDAVTPAQEPTEPPVKKAPAAKKTPAKKTPAKKTPAKKAAAKKAPAKKTPAKKTPAKKAPAKKAQPAPEKLAETNGDLTAAAKEAAAQAKSTVTTASNAVSSRPSNERTDEVASRLPLAAALITGLLAIVAVLYLARRAGSEQP